MLAQWLLLLAYNNSGTSAQAFLTLLCGLTLFLYCAVFHKELLS